MRRHLALVGAPVRVEDRVTHVAHLAARVDRNHHVSGVRVTATAQRARVRRACVACVCGVDVRRGCAAVCGYAACVCGGVRVRRVCAACVCGVRVWRACAAACVGV
eukprot:2612106-Prymnesium_polylepis.1